jgi:CRISPR-associated protein Csd1
LAPPSADEATETDALGQILRDMAAGKPLREAAPRVKPDTRVYVLGLSANAARLSVRFWMEQSIGELARRFTEHWGDLRIEPPPRLWPPPMRALLLELAEQGEAENVPDHLNGEFTRAILSGSPYPRSLLAQAIMRIRADGGVSPLRVALVKAVIARAARKTTPDWKDTLVALDRDESNIGYRLGRLFALLDYVQYLSVGSVNAGVKEKFFASASATPARVFPSILRTSQYHLSDARKSRQTDRAAGWADAEIKQVMDGLPADRPFPPTLSFDDQGRFVVGYYHQRSGRRADTKPDADESSTEKDI